MAETSIPENELERILSLADFDLDYTNHQDSFKDLARLAAKVAGTDISLVNLIDTFTQWTVSNHGLDLDQMPREDSVCQYTIMEQDHFEVEDLSTDARFKDKFYVVDSPKLKYYYGIPLKNDDGYNLGALCVLDTETKEISPEKIELLKIIASEIVNRLKTFKAIDALKLKLDDATEKQKKVAHDIRGPLGGIIGLAQIISEQGKDNQIDEVLEFINLIYKSGRSILDLADEILNSDKPQAVKSDEFNLLLFKDKLEKLYLPQAKNKNIIFKIKVSPASGSTPFSKNKLLQITGNLISNAMKFTPNGGEVIVDLNLKIKKGEANLLRIKVTDTGIGIDKQTIRTILSGSAESTDGTGGEKGYGFGLTLVKHLIESLKGTLNIYSEPEQGATFEVNIPQA
ncbi:GAF domain-containing sensor histidine kinase [Mucilaginibacter sp.]